MEGKESFDGLGCPLVVGQLDGAASSEVGGLMGIGAVIQEEFHGLFVRVIDGLGDRDAFGLVGAREIGADSGGRGAPVFDG